MEENLGSDQKYSTVYFADDADVKIPTIFIQYKLCCSHKPASVQLPVDSVVLGRRLGGNGVNVEKPLKRLFRDKAFET